VAPRSWSHVAIASFAQARMAYPASTTAISSRLSQMGKTAQVLFIPDRFTDYRMWSDIPDRVLDQAEVIHFEARAPIPWTSADGGFLAAVRRIAAARSFTVVVAAGNAARFGFAAAEAGLTAGLMLFYPSLDRILPEVSSSLRDVDWNEQLAPFLSLANALNEPDPARRREIYLQHVRDTTEPGLDRAELETVLAMATDHAEEFLADLQATATAAAAGEPQPDPPWMERAWIDRLENLNVPVTAVVGPRGAIGDAIAARSAGAEIILTAAYPGLGGSAFDRGRVADALGRMIDRVR
jgi:hypothetical protein